MLKKHLLYPAEEQMPIRNGFGEGVVAAGKKNPNVVVLSADLTESTRAHWFKEEFSDRFIEVGVAEQNLVTIASGMAAAGKIPFVTSYAVFSPGRNWEQIRTTICYNDVPVKIVGSHAGLMTGPDGATHQALEDIALMRALPNMSVIVPCDYVEARKAVIESIMRAGPVYIRLVRVKTPVFTTSETPFEFGKAQVFREGSDVTVFACGDMVYKSLQAAEEMAHENIETEVINVPTVKPLDVETIVHSAKKTRAVVTVEDHQINGGLGGAVAELLSEELPTPIKRIGVEDRFGQSGQPEELLVKYGLDVESIIGAVKGMVSVNR